MTTRRASSNGRSPCATRSGWRARACFRAKPASASPRWRPQSAWRSPRQTIIRWIRAWSSARSARPARRPAWICASERACCESSQTPPAGGEAAARCGGGYLVPRSDGRYVLGATVEERGFDVQPAVGGILELMRDCHEIVPGVSELEIEELCVGLRPGTPDNVPAVGWGELEGLMWATGHYRNGILLAPLTAE